jgi:hypothetical protein
MDRPESKYAWRTNHVKWVEYADWLEGELEAVEIQINAMHRENIESQERLAAALLNSHEETQAYIDTLEKNNG